MINLITGMLRKKATGRTISEIILPGVLFETNWSNDTAYSGGSSGLWRLGSDPATGWDGVKVQASSDILVVGEGQNGPNAIRLHWESAKAQPAVSLGKHLTGNISTGYDEIYVRYKVKFPNNSRIGQLVGDPPTSLLINHWKYGRLWQNTHPTDVDTWHENRVDSGYVVWNWNGNIPYTGVNVVWGENVGDSLEAGSAGGERQVQDYFVSGSDRYTTRGYFEKQWPINITDRLGQLENNTTQDWVTLEWRFKLASTLTSDDGIFEMWVNGESWGSPTRLLNQSGAPVRGGIPTGRRGSGFNFFTFFDNIGGWHKQWDDPGVNGHLLVDDVVVSTDRIGHTYVAGNTDNTGVGAT